MRKLTTDEQKNWNTLRFGDLHPKLVRKEFRNILVGDMRKYGFSFNVDDGHKFTTNFIWVPTNNIKNFYECDDPTNDLFSFGLVYNKSFSNWIYTNGNERDITICIGWCPLDNVPSFLIVNDRVKSDDCVKLVANENTAKQVAEEFYEFLSFALTMQFEVKNINKKWVEKIL